MDGLKPTGSRAFEVRKNIEEKNALSGYSNRFNDKLECLRIGLSRADLLRQKYFLENDSQNCRGARTSTNGVPA
jgi:hypothetical protein